MIKVQSLRLRGLVASSLLAFAACSGGPAETNPPSVGDNGQPLATPTGANDGAQDPAVQRDSRGLIGKTLEEARRSLELRLFADARSQAAYVLSLDPANVEARDIVNRCNSVLGDVPRATERSSFEELVQIDAIRRERERKIRKALPDALELIAAIMEGGVAFEGALTHVVRESDPRHPLYFELSVMLDAMRRGRRRHEALKLWGARCNLAEVAEVVAALTQADQTGGSLAAVLHHHARTLFREYEASVQRRAERLPIRMMFPMLLTILPAMFIVTGLPSILRIVRVMEALMRRGM